MLQDVQHDWKSAEEVAMNRKKCGYHPEVGSHRSWLVEIYYLDPHENFWLCDWTENVLTAFFVRDLIH